MTAHREVRMSVCIYTANMGCYDTVRPQVGQDIDVDWLCFTDDLVDDGALPPWRTIDVEPARDTPMLEAKWRKLYPPVGYDYAIWIDANMQVVSPSFAREAIAALHDGATFAVFTHPRRTTVAEEVKASLGVEGQGGRYAGEPLRAQLAFYRTSGFRDDRGLYAGGTIVWTPEAWPVSKAWWDEIIRWSIQDQVSLPYVLWKLDVQPAVFPIPQLERIPMRRARGGERHFGNRWLRIHPHETVSL